VQLKVNSVVLVAVKGRPRLAGLVRSPGFGGMVHVALLARLLGPAVGDAETRLVAGNAEVRRGLAATLQAIAVCRRNRLALLNDVPNVDTMIAASIANQAPGQRAATGGGSGCAGAEVCGAATEDE
jgi:hypothetical protein